MGAATKPTFRQLLTTAGLIFLAAGAGTAIYLVARSAPPPLTLQTRPGELHAEPEPPKTQTPAQPAAAPRVEAPAEVTVPAAQSPTTPEAEPHPKLVGTWQLEVEMHDDQWDEWGRFRLDDTKSPMTADAGVLSNVQSSTEAERDGLKLRIVSKDKDGDFVFTFEGVLNPAYTEANGIYERVYRSREPSIEDVRETNAARLLRLGPEFLRSERQERELRKNRQAEAGFVFEALKRFADRNHGKFPESLAQLTPEDLPDRSLAANQPGRRITYTGGAELPPTEEIAAIAREYKEKGVSTESIVEYERKLREAWGGETPFHMRVLRIEYDNPPLTLNVSSTGHIRRSGEGETDNEAAESLRDSEFNNLKQLGLVCKMFSAANDNYLPGGWLMLYPDYLTDWEVLRSPWAPENTVSYQLLFPGETEKALDAFVGQLIESGSIIVPNAANYEPDSPGWSSLMQSTIPIVISRDNLPPHPEYKPARAVLFLDGHVEAVPLTEWDARIAPFLP